MKLFNKKSSGFTLIELLIVIAVIGVLAAVILVALNPLEQLARGRDAGRKNSTSELSNAVQAYYTSRGGSYPTNGVAWMTTLSNSGDLKTSIGTISLTPACTPNIVNGYCYQNSGTEATVHVALESISEKSRCSAGAISAYFLWSSADARAGVVCNDPAGTYSGFAYK